MSSVWLSIVKVDELNGKSKRTKAFCVRACARVISRSFIIFFFIFFFFSLSSGQIDSLPLDANRIFVFFFVADGNYYLQKQDTLKMNVFSIRFVWFFKSFMLRVRHFANSPAQMVQMPFDLHQIIVILIGLRWSNDSCATTFLFLLLLIV